MIPRQATFIFGLAPDFGGKPFSFVHYLSVASFVVHNPSCTARLFYEHEPQGRWWEELRELIQPIRVSAPTAVGGRRLRHPAHASDLLRLQLLSEYGGVYLDLDTLCVATFPERLWSYPVVLGREEAGGRLVGLCNAVIMAEVGAPFVDEWIAGYDPRTSRWSGFHDCEPGDGYWNELSVKYPAMLASLFPELVRVVPSALFFQPSWESAELAEFFDGDGDVAYPRSVIHHLWESATWSTYLSKLTPESLAGRDDYFSRSARRVLEMLESG